MKINFMHGVQIIISLIILIVLLFNIQMGDLYNYSLNIVFIPVIIVLVMLIPNILLRTYRWKYLYDTNTTRIRFVDSAKLWFVGTALNLALPATTGDVVKSYFGYKWSGVKERMLSISVLEKLIALASIALLGIPFALYQQNSYYAALSIFVMLPFAAALLFPWLLKRLKFIAIMFTNLSRIFSKHINILEVIKQTETTTSKIVIVLLLSVIGWMLTYVQLYFCFSALNIEVSLYYVFSVSPLLTLIRLFPFTLNGIGSDETAMLFFFSGPGASAEAVLVSSILYRFMLLVVPGVIGLFVLAHVKRFKT